MSTIELGSVFLNPRKRRFEFLERSDGGTQPFGHYSQEDAERHREEYAARLRTRGHDVVVEPPG
jgi:hypothetical protein